MYSTKQIDSQVATLKQRVADAEKQLRVLKIALSKAEAQAQAAQDLSLAYDGGLAVEWQNEAMSALSQLMPTLSGQSKSLFSPQAGNQHQRWPLASEEYQRYGRQLIMPEVGLQGQIRLKRSKVLIVGAGGLGCPAAVYLAGAGVGTLGLIDGDTVEVSNLHRQILHSTSKVGMSKVDSAIKYLKEYVYPISTI